MNDFRSKLIRFMAGRYGMDQLNKFLSGTTFVLILLGIFFGGIFTKLSLCTLVIYTYRMMSRNYNRRYEENQVYLKYTEKIRWKATSLKNNFEYRKTHRLYKCPKCKKKLSVPKGKGKIEISCPCGNKFLKKT